MKCLVDKKLCLENYNGECLSTGNCAHQGEVYRQYELNLDKITSVEDCKKILKFLCQTTIKPLPEDYEYCGFSEVEEYFN